MRKPSNNNVRKGNPDVEHVRKQNALISAFAGLIETGKPLHTMSAQELMVLDGTDIELIDALPDEVMGDIFDYLSQSYTSALNRILSFMDREQVLACVHGGFAGFKAAFCKAAVSGVMAKGGTSSKEAAKQAASSLRSHIRQIEE